MIKKISYLILFIIFLLKEKIKLLQDTLKCLYRYRFFNYLIFLIDKNYNPYYDEEYRKFININKKKWEKTKFKINKKSKKILVTSLLHSHPAYCYGEAIIGQNLSEYYKSEMVGLVIKGDIPGEVTLRSFGIKNIKYLDKGNFISRFKLFFKAFKIISQFDGINDFLKFKLDQIDFGKAVYENYVRYTGIGTVDKFDFKFCYFLADAIYIQKFCSKLLNDENIGHVVQSETQFIPPTIIYQFFLSKNIKVYARHGGGKRNSMRIFKDRSEAYTLRSEVSKKKFEEIYENFRELAIKKGELHLKKRFTGKTGNDDAGSVGWAHKKKIDFSKDQLYNYFNWKKEKKIICVFGHALIDGNFLSGWRIFKDNLTWLRTTLNSISEIDDYYWLVKPHPIEIEYAKSKTNTIKEFKSIIGEKDNVKLVPDNISLNSLLDAVESVVTCNGSVALECTSFGKKSLMAGRSDYSDIIFENQIPKNEEEYIEKLKDLEKIKKITQEQIDKSKVYTFIQCHLNLVENPLYPDTFEPNLFANKEKFWEDTCKNLEIYDEKKDFFKKMIFYQLKNGDRHTSNLNELKKLI